MSIDNDVMTSTDDNEERGQNNLYKTHFEGIVALYGQHISAGKNRSKIGPCSGTSKRYLCATAWPNF